MANTRSLDLEKASSQFASRADTTSLSLTGDFTIEAWVKFESIPSVATTHMTIYSKYDFTNTTREYVAQFRSDTDKLTVFYSSDGTNATKIASDSAVTSADV